MRWQEAEVRFWDSYINKAEKIGLVLALENIFELSKVPIIDTYTFRPQIAYSYVSPVLTPLEQLRYTKAI